MKNRLKPFIVPIILIGMMVGLYKAFNLRLAKASSHEIKFDPMKVSDRESMSHEDERPKNMIIFIADGMGFAHLSLAHLTEPDPTEKSIWQSFDIRSWHDTRSAFGPLTDSGASGTAMATGEPTNFEVIGQDKEGKNVSSVLENAQAQGYATGIVTDSYIWDATPAAFVAHTDSRDNAKDILEQIAASKLDLIFGELEDLGEDEVPDYETTIEILERRYQLLDHALAAPEPDSVLKPIAVVFDEDEIQDLESNPTLPMMTEVALRYLSSHDRPFVMVVECEEMDSGSHSNDSRRITRGLRSIEATLKLILDYSREDEETLVIFTSDHETGGLSIVHKEGAYPDMELVWSSRDHIASVVPLFAKGPGSAHFMDVHRNWQIGRRLKELVRIQ